MQRPQLPPLQRQQLPPLQLPQLPPRLQSQLLNLPIPHHHLRPHEEGGASVQAVAQKETALLQPLQQP